MNDSQRSSYEQRGRVWSSALGAHMQRREFIILLAVWPLEAMPRIRAHGRRS